MERDSDYNGDECVVLPTNYLDSIESAVDVQAEQIASVAANLYVHDIDIGPGRRFLRMGLTAVALWLVPVIWMICS